ncbi:hypothetical protein DNH61_19605 [Paenibacillus sambharensis]|uniref:Uncharacterized protein n=2 Tax=Paenibacillus sambharensis TaxID=1803190 RepID=A0A2W1L5H4_9BACL|nr:hypothetical protein DNH61_19605 [Paenibacillus sambharensis]
METEDVERSQKQPMRQAPKEQQIIRTANGLMQAERREALSGMTAADRAPERPASALWSGGRARPHREML